MRPISILAVLTVLTLSPAAFAEDGGARALSLGGAAPAPDNGRVTVWDGGSGVSAGFGVPGRAVFGTSSTQGMQMGGFFAWQAEGYYLDAALAPGLDGSMSSSFGASTGARPGEMGTSYGVRMGAVWSGERFTVNPASRLGMTEVAAPGSDVNLTFTVNHSITPSFSIIGTAEARRNIGSPLDGPIAQNRFLFGAGLGYRF